MATRKGNRVYENSEEGEEGNTWGETWKKTTTTIHETTTNMELGFPTITSTHCTQL